MAELQADTQLLEFEIKQRPIEIAERILAENPRIVGLGVYIWNAAQSTELAGLLKRIRPEVTLILGGPEVSYETEGQSITALADYVVTGEADLTFVGVCRAVLKNEAPSAKIIPSGIPDLNKVTTPYDLYSRDDAANRVIYVEASRGCPFTCEFCLSSLDVPVRQFALQPLLSSLERLMERGVTQFKFVDRTFNLNISTSRSILAFFLERQRPGLFVHFEMVPDRLPADLREIISQFPAGTLQLEVGIQTFDPEAARLISRRQNYGRLAENLTFLKEQTGAHVHADLIAGLPGESVESFGAGFDRLVALGPQEIQVGILKRLRGTPITRHDTTWEMVYAADPPYEILQNKLIDFSGMQRLRRFARYWDLVANSGNFPETGSLLYRRGGTSAFWSFMEFSIWLHRQAGRTDSISLAALCQYLFGYLREVIGLPEEVVASALIRDYQRSGRNDTPEFLRRYSAHQRKERVRTEVSTLPRRQARHLV